MGFEFLLGRIHHVGIAAKDIERQSKHYQRILGLKLVTGFIVDEVHKVKVAFAGLDDGVLLEFVEPIGPDSPVSRIVERGGGLYHVCYMVSEIDRAVHHARDAGALVISQPQPAKAFPGKRIAFIYMPDRSLIEFLEE